MLESELVPSLNDARRIIEEWRVDYYTATAQLTGIPDAERVRGATGASSRASRMLHSVEPNRGLG
jgi:hypothetical protein